MSTVPNHETVRQDFALSPGDSVNRVYNRLRNHSASESQHLYCPIIEDEFEQSIHTKQFRVVVHVSDDNPGTTVSALVCVTSPSGQSTLCSNIGQPAHSNGALATNAVVPNGLYSDGAAQILITGMLDITSVEPLAPFAYAFVQVFLPPAGSFFEPRLVGYSVCVDDPMGSCSFPVLNIDPEPMPRPNP
jgi:hypothetical protein